MQPSNHTRQANSSSYLCSSTTTTTIKIMLAQRSALPRWAVIAIAALVLLATSTLAAPSSPENSTSPIPPAKQPHHHHKHQQKQVRDEWSSIMGWVSIACWVLPSFSQMHQNYVSKSAEGLSITFVVIWLAGDALNAAGAWFQGLLWTMIILALYYCACDCVLIFQYWYYSKYYHRGVKISTISASLEANERTPLIGDGSVIEDDLSAKDDSDDDSSVRTQIIMYTIAALLVVATGVAAWWVAEHSYGSDDDLPPAAPEPILKNRTTKCEGLSLALFVFAVAGNLTYVASILLKSTKHDYLVESFSWLVGSLGTVFLDFIVLGQFIHYRRARREIHRLRRSSIAHHERERPRINATPSA
ncbi:PQ-loop-domain-containing protein [Moesziomyces antarcticus]|uniref:PQ-loop-domain-containing protein n=1 Tax=Pseudozyma antarctica TaxID=84753 RepID=A0A081CL24_PSEA2|nr:PQ-loop-domain-containing protein [Moesziomyces antarcticus]GAK67370.1 PQ-loop-domain-containing protein [Moesziomyces antarcticus]